MFTPRATQSTLVMVRCTTELQTRQPLRKPTKKGGCLSGGEIYRFNLRAVREQGSDRISAALAYAACA